MTAKAKNGNHLIARNDDLDKKMAKHPDIDQNIEKLFAIGRRNRRLIIAVYILIAIELVTLVTVAYFISVSYVNKNRAERNHTILISNCTAGNDFRKDNLALWAYILHVPSPQPPTDTQKKTITDFTSFVNKTFALRDCTKVK